VPLVELDAPEKVGRPPLVHLCGAGGARQSFKLKPELLWSTGGVIVASDLVLEPYAAAILRLV
jgi:hypothetical protein